MLTIRSSREAARLELEHGAEWRHFCFCSDAPAPDPAIGQAAQQNAEIGREALAFQKTMYEDYKPYLERLANTSQEAADIQIGTARKQAEQADDYQAYMKDTFRPVEKALVDEAMSYDTAAEGERMAGEAAAKVGESFGVGRRTMERQMADQGININDGAYAGGTRQLAMKQASETAGAANKGRQDAETIGWAKKMDAASLGRNLPGNQATSASLATSAAGAGVNSSGAAGQGVAQGANMMQQGYGTAIQGNTAAGNLYLGQYQAQANAAAQDDGLFGGLGTIIGAGITKWSSKKLKTNKTKIDNDKALEAIQETPVEAWDYKPGVEDGGRHIGPYAEDVKKNFGVGDGKSVNLMDELGVTMAAVKGLAEKVERLESNFGVRRKS